MKICESKWNSLRQVCLVINVHNYEIPFFSKKIFFMIINILLYNFLVTCIIFYKNGVTKSEISVKYKSGTWPGWSVALKRLREGPPMQPYWWVQWPSWAKTLSSYQWSVWELTQSQMLSLITTWPSKLQSKVLYYIGVPIATFRLLIVGAPFKLTIDRIHFYVNLFTYVLNKLYIDYTGKKTWWNQRERSTVANFTLA